MLLSWHELLDIIIMTAVMGFLFMDSFKAPKKLNLDVLEQFKKQKTAWKENFLFAAALIAPTIILHELAHKFVAMAFGLQATFHAFYASQMTLMLGIFAIVAKFTGLGFVFLVPGYVSISGSAHPAIFSLIAFAGPAVHGLAWLGAKYYLYTKKDEKIPQKKKIFIYLFQRINGFLFVINMLPIPGIDGFTVYKGLLGGLF